MSTTTPNLGLFKYNTTTDSSVPFNINTALNANWDILDERCGSSRNIGEIVASTIPLTDAGLHLLDGSLINGSGIYSDFVDYIADLYDSGDYTAIFDTEANWQTAVTTYGVCGKFVYTAASGNTAATVRLPKITGFVEGASGVATLGDLTEAGLPNITGEFSRLGGGGSADTGCVYSTGNGGNSYYGNNDPHYAIDASLSSSIYGNSSTVQPQSIKVLYYIVVATSTKTDIQVDIDEIVTDLNGKTDVDLSNCTKPHIVETYVAEYSGYRIWSDGFCEQWGVGTNITGNEITLLQPYKDTKGIILVTPATATLPTQVAGNPIGAFLSNSKIVVSASNGYSGVYWLTRGYIN